MAKTKLKPESKKIDKQFQSRITRSEMVDPKKLVTNNKNFRKHPSIQRAAMENILDTLGWIQEIIVNERTGHMIDGHMRLDLALKHKQNLVPVKYVDLSEEEEELALSTFDPISAYATYDKNVYDKLIKSLSDTDQVLGDGIRTLLETDAESIGLSLQSSYDAAVGEVTMEVDEKNDKKGTSKNKTKDILGEDARVYDGRDNATDVGTGPCLHKCLYCFTGASRAAISWKGMRPKAAGEMTKEVEKASHHTRLLEIGSANDPSMEVFYEPLREAIEAAKKHRVYLVFQTKNPGYFVDVLTRLKMPPNQVTIRTSFATLLDHVSDKLEPGTEPPTKRREKMVELANMGVDVNFRLSPLFLGEYSQLDKFLSVLGTAGVASVSCELIRISRIAESNYFSRINGMLREGWNITQYFEKYGRRGEYAATGSAGWYEYDPHLVREELTQIRKWVHDAGMMFLLENYETTFSNYDLSDGLHPLDTPAIRKFGVKISEDILSTRIKNGTIDALRCDYLREAKVGTAEYDRRLKLVMLANQQHRPLLGPTPSSNLKGNNDGKEESSKEGRSEEGRKKGRKKGR